MGGYLGALLGLVAVGIFIAFLRRSGPDRTLVARNAGELRRGWFGIVAITALFGSIAAICLVVGATNRGH
jgi:hypothetical protein